MFLLIKEVLLIRKFHVITMKIFVENPKEKQKASENSPLGSWSEFEDVAATKEKLSSIKSYLVTQHFLFLLSL